MPNELNDRPLSQAAIEEQLKRLERAGNGVELRADRKGATAEVTASWRNGWGLVAYAQRQWNGLWNAGGRVRKTWE
jgi:hypothetical protein